MNSEGRHAPRTSCERVNRVCLTGASRDAFGRIEVAMGDAPIGGLGGVGDGWEGGGRAGAGGRKGWGWEEKAANTHTASVAFARHRAGAVAEQSPSRSPA